MSLEPCGHRPPLKRIEVGQADQPVKTREEQYAQSRADRDMTEMRLKASEAMWQTVVEAAGGTVNAGIDGETVEGE